MVAEAYVAVDVEKAVVAWARAQGFTAFFGVNNNGTFPQIVVQRVAGPDSNVLIQFDVWAASRDAGGSKQQAADAASALRTAITGMGVYDHVGIRLHGASDPTARWLPDPVSDQSRYIVEASFTATAL